MDFFCLVHALAVRPHALADGGAQRLRQALKRLHADHEATGSGVVQLMYDGVFVYDCS